MEKFEQEGLMFTGCDLEKERMEVKKYTFMIIYFYQMNKIINKDLWIERPSILFGGSVPSGV